MSNYRDTVRDMMKDLKTAKKSDKTSTAEKKASKKSDEEAEKTGPVPVRRLRPLPARLAKGRGRTVCLARGA